MGSTDGTWKGGLGRARGACSPPKPAPTITTRGIAAGTDSRAGSMLCGATSCSLAFFVSVSGTSFMSTTSSGSVYLFAHRIRVAHSPHHFRHPFLTPASDQDD